MTSARSAQPSLRLQRWQYNVTITEPRHPVHLGSGKGDRLTTFIFYIWITFVTEIIKLLNNKRGKKLQKLKNIVTRRGHVTRVITRSIDTCQLRLTCPWCGRVPPAGLPWLLPADRAPCDPRRNRQQPCTGTFLDILYYLSDRIFRLWGERNICLSDVTKFYSCYYIYWRRGQECYNIAGRGLNQTLLFLSTIYVFKNGNHKLSISTLRRGI